MKGLTGFNIRQRMPILIVVTGVWFAILLGVALLINLPRAEEISTLKSDLSSFDSLVSSRGAKVARLRRQFRRVIDGKRSLDTFYHEVLSTKRERMTPVQKELRTIAGKFNIKPESITYVKQTFKEDPQIVKFSASLPLTGSYENLRAFIDAVEHSENFLTIQSIQLSDSKEGGVMLSLNISVATYFFDMDIQPKSAPGGRT